MVLVFRDQTEHRRAEDALAAERTLLRTLIDNLPDFVYVKDTEGRFLVANRSVANHMGAGSPDDLLGKTDADFYPGGPAAAFRSDEEAILRSGLAMVDQDEPNTDAAGNQRWILTTKLPLRDARGEIVGLVGIGHDITERKRAEEALRRSEERYRALIGTAIEGFWVLDREGRLLEVNDAYCAMSGRTREALLSMHIQDLEFQETLPEVQAHIQKIVANGSDRFETKHRRADGSVFDVEASVVFLDVQARFLSFVVDITERKRSEEVLAFLAQSSGATTGEDFFESLAKYLAQSLAMDFVCIDRLEGDELTGQTVAVWCDGKFEDNVTYALKDTPCGDVIGKTVCCFPAGVCQMFPRDAVLQDLRAESYVGVTLWSHTGQPIGLIAVIGRKPLVNRHLAESVLKLVAVRAAGEMERNRAEEALKISQQQLRLFIDASPDMYFLKDLDLRYLLVNAANAAFFERDGVDILGKTDSDLMPEENAARCRATDLQAMHEKRIVVSTETAGDRVYETRKIPVIAEGEVAGMLGIIRDITEKKRTEEALQRKSAADAALAELSAELLKPGERIEDVCPVVLRHALALTDSEHGFVATIDAKTGDMVNHSLTEMMGKGCRVAEPEKHIAFSRGADGRYAGLCGYSLNTREPFFTNAPSEHPAAVGLPKGHIPLRGFLAVPVVVEGDLLGQLAVANAARDYTPEDLESVRRLAELYGMFLRDRHAKANLKQSEEQLRQAMKMEAVGRLAGGVAHDFNNMLQVILSNADMARTEFPPDSPVQECLHEILKAGQRSADLTRQLLAFARKQTIAPRLLDLNEVVGGMLKMLGRLIGEDIRLSWKPAGNLGQVKMDPSQIDQILANLVVNARDAIAGVGRVTIETGNVELDAAFCEAHAGFAPGLYVLLAVSDNGCGMDQETQAKIFEPFFTTKEMGKGTGLGLATVYGVVKQNDGFIDVYSEPGQGTAFKIYLPWHAAEAPAASVKREPAALLRGTETVLLVEDEASVLRLGKRLLEHLGYTVLAADSPPKAIRMAGETAGVIHLLITDVVMPGMSGRDLWQRLSPTRPGLKCLFMSGYTADIIGRQGVLDEKVHFLGKPFSVEALAAKAREALDSEG